MPLPTRPVSGASIASVWGQAVHDYTFAPAGARVNGAAVAMLASAAVRTLPMDTASIDPGGYLDAANDRLDVPANGEGEYLFMARMATIDGGTDQTRVVLRVNGSTVASATAQNDSGTTVVFFIAFQGSLTAGDLVDLRAFQVGSGSRADVNIGSATLIRLGDELGAP